MDLNAEPEVQNMLNDVLEVVGQNQPIIREVCHHDVLSWLWRSWTTAKEMFCIREVASRHSTGSCGKLLRGNHKIHCGV